MLERKVRKQKDLTLLGVLNLVVIHCDEGVLLYAHVK